MAHFAELDEANVVTQVIVVANAELLDGGIESEAKGIEFLQSLFGHNRWKQTSYNANGNPAKRYNYAGLGFLYDPAREAFIPPKPFDSWALDDATCLWVAPVPYPNDGCLYQWDENTLDWVLEDAKIPPVAPL